MDYLSFISGEFDKQIAENKDTEVAEAKPTEPVKENLCQHDQVLGDPRSGGICLYCNEHLS